MHYSPELLDAAFRLIHLLTASTPAPPPASYTASWSFLSPLTRRVVRLLAAEGWLCREEIARQIGEPPEGKLTTLLPDLVERGIIESSPRKGYQLAMPDDAEPEAFRRHLLASLKEEKVDDAK